ncbi:MAG: acyltransferase [Desulfuromonadaceae bacterium]
MLRYCTNYILLNVISPLIPHPKVRALYLKLLGASIGKNVRIERVIFIQVQNSITNLCCGDNSFIGSQVILDLSEAIVLGNYAIIAPGCSVITHQDFGDFNGNKLSTIFKTKYRPVRLLENAVVGADTTILAGSIIGSCSIVGAKSLVNGDVPEKTLVSGIPAKVVKYFGDTI